MSREQLKRAHVLRMYNEGLMNRKEAAEALRLSERQITRLGKGVREPTRPIRGATIPIHDLTAGLSDFNPRAPYGARRDANKVWWTDNGISTHAPHTGRDSRSASRRQG